MDGKRLFGNDEEKTEVPTKFTSQLLEIAKELEKKAKEDQDETDRSWPNLAFLTATLLRALAKEKTA